MPGNILTVGSTIMCLHGGQAILTTANSKLLVDNLPALLESDVHAVAGCPFQIPFGTGTKPSPCVRIEWSAGSVRVAVNGAGVLVRTSVGKCFSPEGAPQGLAVIANTQVRTTAQ
jgi:hypothetical protein